jgi:hypothetical protein
MQFEKYYIITLEFVYRINIQKFLANFYSKQILGIKFAMGFLEQNGLKLKLLLN